MRQHGVRYMGGFVSLFLDWINSPAVLMGTAGALVRFVSCLSTKVYIYICLSCGSALFRQRMAVPVLFIFLKFTGVSGVLASVLAMRGQIACLSVCLFFFEGALYTRNSNFRLLGRDLLCPLCFFFFFSFLLLLFSSPCGFCGCSI